MRLDVELLEQSLGEAVRLHHLLQVVGHEAQAALPAPVRETLLSVPGDIKKKLNYPLNYDTAASVADPDPYVFGPSGSGSISQMYGSGSLPTSLSKNSKKNLDFYSFLTSF